MTLTLTQDSDFGLRTSDFGLLTSDFWLLTSVRIIPVDARSALRDNGGRVDPERCAMPVVTEHLDQWVRKGFLSGDQATAIREYEDHPSSSRPTAVLEVLGYVGAVFVLVAGLLLVVELWTDMSRAAQAALAGSAAAVLTVSGVVIARTEHPRIRRVGAALLLLALVPTGVAVGLVTDTWFAELSSR